MPNPYAQRAFEYRSQEVLNASPVRLVILAYDAALAACGRRDLPRATRAIATLRDSLNFEHREIAARLFALYLWCADQCREGRWEDAISVLAELREAWVQAEQKLSLPRPVSIAALGAQLQLAAA